MGRTGQGAGVRETEGRKTKGWSGVKNGARVEAGKVVGKLREGRKKTGKWFA